MAWKMSTNCPRTSVHPRWQRSPLPSRACAPVSDVSEPDRLPSSSGESLYAERALPLKKLSKRSLFLVLAASREGLRVAVSCATIGDEATNGGEVLAPWGVLAPCGRAFAPWGVLAPRGGVLVPWRVLPQCGRVLAPWRGVLAPCGRVPAPWGRVLVPCASSDILRALFLHDAASYGYQTKTSRMPIESTASTQ